MQAVIYARVSSAKQVSEGHGLDSQIHRCQQYAQGKGCPVINTFTDGGISGTLSDRKGVNELLLYLFDHPQTVVIIDDVSRLARDTLIFKELQKKIELLKCRIEFLNQNQGTGVDAEMVIDLAAVMASYTGKKNREQVKNRMLARMQAGYWILPCPIGYCFDPSDKIKIPKLKQPEAGIIQEGLKKLANGTLTRLQDFVEFCQNKGVKNHKSKLVMVPVNRFYTGYYDYMPWGIKLTQGQHNPLITLKEFDKIQTMLNQNKYTKRVNLELFLLKHKINCAGCGKLLTTQISTNRHQKHFYYYLCRRKGCKFKNLNQPKADLEGRVAGMLKNIQITAKQAKAIKWVVEKHLDESQKHSQKAKVDLETSLAKAESEADKLAEHSLIATGERVQNLINSKLEKAEMEIQNLKNQLKNLQNPISDLDYHTLTNDSLEFAQNLDKKWTNGDFLGKQKVLDLVFSGPLVWEPKIGYHTPVLSSMFAVFEQKKAPRFDWCTQRDSNPRPFVPKTNALIH